jgi:hypothetical protein
VEDMKLLKSNLGVLTDTTSRIAYDQLVLSHAPEAYYRLGDLDAFGSGRLEDSSTYNNQGVYSDEGTHAWVSPGALARDYDACASFGPSGYAIINVDIQNNFDNITFAIEAWIWVSAVSMASGYRTIIGKGYPAMWELGILNNSVYFYSNQTLASYEISSSGFHTLAPSTWYHIVAHKDESDLRLYINGVQVNSVFTDINIQQDYTDRLLIGARPAAADTFDRYFQGRIDELALYR